MKEINSPKEWLSTKISDVSVKGTQRKPNSDEIFDYIDIGSIDRELKKIATPQQITGKNAPSRARKVVNEGDVIVSLTRPNLNAVALVPSKYDEQIASTGFEVIRPILVEPKYIFSMTRTKHFIDNITGAGQGALYPAAKSSDVQAYSFFLPPLAEQQEIANQLDSLLAKVDSIKNRLDAIPDIIKRFRQSVLAAAVSGKLTDEWRKKQHHSLDEWKLKSLGDVALVQTGSTPLKSENKYYDDGDIPWLTSSVTGQRMVTTSEQFVTSLAVEECRLKIFEPGTLLVAMYGEGKTRGQVTEIAIRAATNQACAAVVVDSNKANKSYVKLCIEASYQETRRLAEGGNQPNLNLSKVRSIPVYLPPHIEQQEVINVVEKLFSVADKVEEKVSAAQELVNNLTQTILAKAFRGELTSEWREFNQALITGENSAEALLAKIKAERDALYKKKSSKKKTVKKQTTTRKAQD
jgi:type I restriction enzyme S subunit